MDSHVTPQKTGPERPSDLPTLVGESWGHGQLRPSCLAFHTNIPVLGKLGRVPLADRVHIVFTFCSNQCQAHRRHSLNVCQIDGKTTFPHTSETPFWP